MRFIRQNKEVLILIILVCCGIWAMLKYENINVAYTPRQIDMQCMGIFVPDEVKDKYRYCHCMRVGFVSDRPQRQQHCLKTAK